MIDRHDRSFIESLFRDAAAEMHNRIMEVYEEYRSKVFKGELTPKEFGKYMDYASAAALRDFLEREGFKPKVYSEEWFEDYRPSSGDILVVDPLDGTSNISRGVRYSAISLAISDGPYLDNVYAGYVRNVFTGESYFAYIGEGAYKDGSRIRVRPTMKTIDAFVSVAITHEIPGKSRSLEILRYTNYPRHLGSAALEDCLVAEGIFDLHIDIRGSLRVYDIGASQLIVREAGGRVWMRQGNSRKISIEKIGRVDIISAATPHLLEKTLDILGL